MLRMLWKAIILIAGLRGVAQLGSIWNLPVFSWVSDLLDFKDTDKYTTLVRLSGPLYAIGKSIIDFNVVYFYSYILRYTILQCKSTILSKKGGYRK